MAQLNPQTATVQFKHGDLVATEFGLGRIVHLETSLPAGSWERWIVDLEDKDALCVSPAAFWPSAIAKYPLEPRTQAHCDTVRDLIKKLERGSQFSTPTCQHISPRGESLLWSQCAQKLGLPIGIAFPLFCNRTPVSRKIAILNLYTHTH